MKRLFLVCCGMFAGLVGLTDCTKNEVVTPDVESVDFTACIEDVDTKTALNGLKVNWAKDDKIGFKYLETTLRMRLPLRRRIQALTECTDWPMKPQALMWESSASYVWRRN